MPPNATQPAAVIFQRHDGTWGEELFASRVQAEVWLALIPMLQLNGQHLEIARASIRPCAWGWN